MDAFLPLALFGFGKRNEVKGEEPKRKGPSGSLFSGFKSDVSDEIHGGHLDGDALVLSGALGGGRYPVREAGGWVSDDVEGCRLVFQPIDMMGRRTGPLYVTTNLISRAVAESVIRADGLSGMLSVHMPDRRLATELMASCGVAAPLDYSFTADLTDSSSASLRRRRWDGDALAGPMCLYGPFLSREELESEAGAGPKMDFVFGFHRTGDGHLELSSDLGEARFRPVASSEDRIPSGTFRILLDTSSPEWAEGGGPIVTDAEISRHTALCICSDFMRHGVLNVYTPERGDAIGLMEEALGGKRPSEMRMSDGTPCFGAPSGKGNKARAAYGRPGE